MEILSSQAVGLAVPEVYTFEVDNVPSDHHEWAAEFRDFEIEHIVVDGVSSHIYNSDPTTSYTMARTAKGQKRDWWAGDHIWHEDRTHAENPPVFTVIGCTEAEDGSPKTDIIDTTELLDMTIDDGFWKRYGIEEKDLEDFYGIFRDSTYQREALPFIRSLMDQADQQTLDRIIITDIVRAGCSSIEELLAKIDTEHPERQYPLVARTPLSNMQCLFLDGGGRNSKLLDAEGNDRTNVLQALRWEYLTDDQPTKLGLVRSIGWTAGKCLIFPQRGTIHRAQPGNQHDRVLQLCFLLNAA